MASVVWAVATVLLGILEGITAELVAVWFALGALAAFVASLLGASLWVQLVVFCGVSLVSLLATRPLVRRVLKVRQVPTNADGLVGKSAVVTEAVSRISGTGRVKAGGLGWKALCETEEELPVDTVVNILRIEGVTLIVERQKQEAAQL